MTRIRSKPASRRKRQPTGGDYPVGKGKPPVHTRFQPGQSGNPKGRKKNQPTVHDQVSAVLQRRIPLTEHGTARMVSVQEGMLLAIGQKALRGDLKAVAFLLNLREATRESNATLIDPTELAAFDQATLRRYIEDALAREAPDGDGQAPDPDTSTPPNSIPTVADLEV